MTKMFVGIDRYDGVESIFLVNDHGVLVFARGFVIDRKQEIRAAKVLEGITPSFMYLNDDRFIDAINPKLIGEW